MSRLARIILCAGVLFSAGACAGGGGGSSDNGSSGDTGGDFSSGDTSTFGRVIDAYVNDFVIPDYAEMDQAAAVLQGAADALAASQTDANLQAARAAWVAIRVPYEKGEAALFGPIDFYGFDPALDSWPVNKTDFDAVLASGTPLNADTIRNFDNTLKGFHAIEYLLWGVDSQKSADQLTARELEYLQALTDDVRNTTSSLLNSWTVGIAGQRPYALEVTQAGQGSAVFPTQQAALEQMVQSMLGICDEVANGKIADPFDARNPDIVESQFSFNSIADFSNDIRGVQDGYTKAVSIYISSVDSGLDAKVKEQIQNAINAIQAIPEPFRNSILSSSNDSVIVNAQQAIRTLSNTLQGEVLPLVVS
jgi:predicted lipoprotein